MIGSMIPRSRGACCIIWRVSSDAPHDVARPTRIYGGFDTAIFGFTLDAVPPQWQGPLILRFSRPGVDPQRVKLETVVQNTLAGMGYPAPAVLETELDPDILGGPFMVMRRVRGQTLAHEAEGLGAGRSPTERVSLPSASHPCSAASSSNRWRCRSVCIN